MMNSKGMTLIELLISIVLITIVMFFLTELLYNVKNNNKNLDYAYDNQFIRSEIIKTIEQDLLKNDIKTIELRSEYEFIFNNNARIVVADEGEYLIYKNFAGQTQKWTLKNGIFKIFDYDIFRYYNDIDNNESYFKIVFHIVSDNYAKEYDNPIDDIEINYAKDNGIIEIK